MLNFKEFCLKTVADAGKNLELPENIEAEIQAALVGEDCNPMAYLIIAQLLENYQGYWQVEFKREVTPYLKAMTDKMDTMAIGNISWN